MSFAEIKCPHCGASGRVDNDANSPFMMGRCPVCGGYVVYFCGASLALEDDVIATHSLETIRNHILARIDDFLEGRLTEFLEEYSDEFEIHHHAVRQLEEYCDEVEEESFTDGLPENLLPEAEAEDLEPPELSAPTPLQRPSIRTPDLGQITDDEVKDFLEIDLHLIDRAAHFNRHFGS